MFRAILYSQWKWSRLIILPGVVAAFALPIVSVQGAGGHNPVSAEALLRAVQSWGTLYPVLAAALGLLVAVASWAPDHRGRHVHALTLPLPRWRYVLLRFGAGVAVLAAPITMLALGALLATSTATLPAGLQGYPVGLALRFALAVLLAYAIFFAVAAGTARTAGIILGLLGGLVAVQVLAQAAGFDTGLPDVVQILVLHGPGPFAVFGGRWMLIDV